MNELHETFTGRKRNRSDSDLHPWCTEKVVSDKLELSGFDYKSKGHITRRRKTICFVEEWFSGNSSKGKSPSYAYLKGS